MVLSKCFLGLLFKSLNFYPGFRGGILERIKLDFIRAALRHSKMDLQNFSRHEAWCSFKFGCIIIKNTSTCIGTGLPAIDLGHAVGKYTSELSYIKY